MKRFAMQPQALNYYSYVANSPIVLVDPTGEGIEDVARYVKKTALYNVWASAVGVLGATSKQIAADFLFHSMNHSLSMQPGQESSVTYGDSSYVANEVKSSAEYGKLIYEKIAPGIANGEFKGKGTLEFTPSNSTTDLYYALHEAGYYYNVTDSAEGNYDLSITVYDVYDYTDTGKFDGFVGIANDTAVISQNLGVLQPFDLTININDQISKQTIDSYE